MSITAKVIHDSISKDGKRITTFELEYPRFIHAEFMTHRLFSRNSASSRAIPIEKMNEHILNNIASPVHWGKNQPGMQAKEELGEFEMQQAQLLWKTAAYQAVDYSKAFHKVGTHKQIANRVTEPFQHMKVVLTATEYANWFWLRDHKDAQPEIAVLAQQMKEAYEASEPMEIKENEWHVPYINRTRSTNGQLVYMDANGYVLSDVDARMVSASCCAQVSYRKTDDSLDKALKIYRQLIESEPCHASPIEHQATPIVVKKSKKAEWQDGVTHQDREGKLWSGNFQGWVQFRQLINNNAKW